MGPAPITRHIRRVNTPMVLDRMSLDTRPHLLQAGIQLALVLLLVRVQVDKVVGVVGGVVGGAAGGGEWGCGLGGIGRGGGCWPGGG